MEDVEEVSHYIAAMNLGLGKLREEYPISLRLIKEMHATLLRGGRGSKKQPGEFRHSQNWIGGTRPGNATFVPPPHEKLAELLGNLEHYINDSYGTVPALLKAAIAHVQFETIHPFLDGNGRIGRLLITLILCKEGLLSQPVLYLSLYLKKHRTYYYELLNEVRHQGAWEKWITFFLEGLIETAQEATKNAKTIADLFAADKAKIATLKRAAPNALRVFEYLQARILCQIPQAAAALELTQPTITSALANLEELGIVKEVSGRKKDRLFCYEGYRGLISPT
jgi:Fic family protein